MAAILKLRRDTTTPSLVQSELFFNTKDTTLIIGDGSTNHTLVKLGENTGSLSFIGDITASNLKLSGDANIDGNITLGGNIIIGDSDTDSISITAELSSSLIPNDDNQYDLGSSSKRYKNLHVVSASIENIKVPGSGILSSSATDFVTYSSSIDSRVESLVTSASNHDNRLDNLELTSQSHDDRITQLETDTGSQDNRLDNLELTSASHDDRLDQLEVDSGSQDGRLTNLELTSQSHDDRLSQLETSSGSQDNRLDNLELTSQSLENRATNLELTSQSLENRATNLELTSQSLENRATNLELTSASHDDRLSQLETTSGSHNNRLDNLESTGSDHESRLDTLETGFSSSVDTRLDNLESTGSDHESRVDSIESFTSSFENAISLGGSNVTVLGNLTVQGTQTSLNSNTLNVSDLNILLASGAVDSATADGAGITIDGANQSIIWDHTNSRFNISSNVSSSGFVGDGSGLDNVVAASVDYANVTNKPTLISGSSQLTNLNAFTESADNRLTNLESTTSSLDLRVSSLENVSESHDGRLDNLETTTSSFDGRLDNLETTTSSFESRISNEEQKSITLESVTSSLESRANNLELTSQSLENRTDNLELTSQSLENRSSNLELTSASHDTRISSLEQVTSSYETKGNGIISSSAFSSPSQGVVRATINGTQTNVNTGLETTDTPTFNSVVLSSVDLGTVDTFDGIFLSGSGDLVYRTLGNAAFYNVSSSVGNDPNSIPTNAAVDAALIAAGAGDITAVNDSSIYSSNNTGIKHTGQGTDDGGYGKSGNVVIAIDTGSTHFTDGVNGVVQLGDGIVSGSDQVTSSLDSRYVNTTGTETIGGDKTFSNNLTIGGNLLVQGETTFTSTNNISIGDNILELNFGGAATEGGIYVKDATGGSATSGSLLWDSTNDYWKAGKLGSESEIITTSNIINNLPNGVVSGSIQITGGSTLLSSSNENFSEFSSSVHDTFAGLSTDYNDLQNIPSGILSSSNENFTQFSSSVDNRISSNDSDINTLGSTNNAQNTRLGLLETETGSIATEQATQDGRLDNLESTTASIDTVQTTQNARLTSLESFTGSIDDTYVSQAELASATGALETVDSSQQAILDSLNAYTASNDTTNYIQEQRLLGLEAETGSISTEQSAQDARLTSLETKTGSLDTTNTAQDARLTSLETKTGSLDTTNTAQDVRLTSLEAETGSISTEQAIQDGRLSQIESVTSSLDGNYEQKSSGTHTLISGSDQVTSSLDSRYVNVTGTESIGGDKTFSDNVIVTGNLTVSGTTTTVNSNTVNIGDNILVLNSDETGTPSQNGGLEIERGTSTNATILWDESNDYWVAGLAGSEARIVIGAGNTSITTLGTISTGTWEGTAIADSYISSATTWNAKLDSAGTIANNDYAKYDANGDLIGRSYTEVKTDLSLNNVENTALSTYTGNGGALDNQYITNGAGYITSFDITTQTDSKYLRSDADDTASGIITFSNTTNSTSKTTGAVKISGGVGIAKTLNVGEDVVAYASSDRRLKDEIQPISDPISKINQIGGYSFVWNEEKQNIYKGKDYGVIAQEIEEILPELVQNRENGYKAVKYDKLVSLLIEGIKELSKEVEDLKKKIN